ncbi:uncharacterized protein LOC122512308 isoform X3 [Leptopilina heterotoma]|uniref:uncharacterized protein LOC122512308 isoform X3 n=1 Tax=Leptopilina heterotoma TaxID=63436 RepID=UPI001CA8D7FB|nr:uncharacterized protein LOC122512308 isoform X3 [Leptopilina heterotoma]
MTQVHPDLNDAKTCSKDLFDKIDRNESCINLPKSWNKINIVWRSQRGIVFLDRIGIKGENGRIDSVSTKEVTIDEEMTLLIKIHEILWMLCAKRLLILKKDQERSQCN